MSRYKGLVFFVSILFCTMFLTGCFYVAKQTGNLTQDCIKDFVLRKFLENNISQVEFCFLKIFFWLALFAISFVLSFLKMGSFFVVLVFSYQSFCLGTTFVYIIHRCGVIKGLLIALFGYFVTKLFLIAIFCILFLIICKHNTQFCSFGNCFIRKNEMIIILKVFCIKIVLIILQSILLFALRGLFIFL